MAHYRIVQRTAALPGDPGDEVRIDPGPMVTALVRAGALQRLLDPQAPPVVLLDAPSDSDAVLEESGSDTDVASKPGKRSRK